MIPSRYFFPSKQKQRFFHLSFKFKETKDFLSFCFEADREKDGTTPGGGGANEKLRGQRKHKRKSLFHFSHDKKKINVKISGFSKKEILFDQLVPSVLPQSYGAYWIFGGGPPSPKSLPRAAAGAGGR